MVGRANWNIIIFRIPIKLYTGCVPIPEEKEMAYFMKYKIDEDYIEKFNNVDRNQSIA